MKTKYLLPLFCSSLLLIGCQNTPKKEEQKNQEVAESPETEWTLLSQENSLEGWHIFQNEDG
ncbi:MAG: hypothetical protein VW979_07220, partial [Flavobacteriaceae bacterium]